MSFLPAARTDESPSSTSSRLCVHGSASPPGRRLRTACLLALIGAALLAPIWTVRYVPFGDYPNHLASAFVLAHLHDPRFAFPSFYAARWKAYPYLMMSGILFLLQKAVSIHVAGRMLLSLCALVVPAAAWWFLREVNPGEEMLAVWALIVAQNLYFFLNGFINMQLSVGLCLAVLAGWTRWLRNPRAVWWCLLAVAVTALYFTHLMGLAIAGLALTAYTLAARRRFRELLMGWALFIPAAFFYWHAEGRLDSSWKISFRPLAGKLIGLLTTVLGVSPSLDFFTLVAGGLCWFWACRENRDFRWRAPWAAAAGLLFALYWVFPAVYGPGQNADFRLLPFVVVIGLAAVRVGRRRQSLALVALLLFFIRAAALEYHVVALQPRLRALAEAASVIPTGSRVLPLVPSQLGIPLAESQLWAYGVIERGWFSPCLFHDPGVQPLAIKLNAYNPYAPSSCRELKQIDWARVRRDYDYLWVFHTSEYDANLRNVGSLVDAVDGLRLYRVKHAALAEPARLQQPPGGGAPRHISDRSSAQWEPPSEANAAYEQPIQTPTKRTYP
jgi:hypothetical protein